MNRETQIRKIWRFLEAHPEGITTFEAYIFLNVTKLSTRISEMIRDGYPISKTPVIRKTEDGVTQRFMRYRKAAEV